MIPIPFSESFEEASSTTPIFFILSPGVDPLNDVEALGKRLNYLEKMGNFHSISLGQGQELIAEQAMEKAKKEGHWVILQNIHLVKRWLPKLEKRICDQFEFDPLCVDTNHAIYFWLAAIHLRNTCTVRKHSGQNQLFTLFTTCSMEKCHLL